MTMIQRLVSTRNIMVASTMLRVSYFMSCPVT
jgi:hypothetical protein